MFLIRGNVSHVSSLIHENAIGFFPLDTTESREGLENSSSGQAYSIASTIPTVTCVNAVKESVQ